MVSITDVPSGLACGCVCPECKCQLVAKKGAVVRHHFAHHTITGCVGGFETMAHMLAKQIIADARGITLPEAVAERHDLRKVVNDAKWVPFDEVSLEVWQDGLRPDVVGRLRGRELAIEIFVTHKCDQEKIDILRDRGTETIEISLGEFRRHFDSDKFKEAVLRTAPRWWVCYSLIDKALMEFDVILTQRSEEARAQAAREREEQDARARIEAAAHAKWLEEEPLRAARREIIRQEAAEREASRLAQEAIEREAYLASIQAEEAKRVAEDEARRIAYEVAEAKREAKRKEQEAEWARANAESLAKFKTAITRDAIALLGSTDANRWLNQDRILTGIRGVNHLKYMPGNPGDWLQALHMELSNKGRINQIHQDNKARVLMAAERHFRDKDKAFLWFKSTNPKLGRQSPMNVCADLTGTEQCLAMLK